MHFLQEEGFYAPHGHEINPLVAPDGWQLPPSSCPAAPRDARADGVPLWPAQAPYGRQLMAAASVMRPAALPFTSPRGDPRQWPAGAGTTSERVLLDGRGGGSAYAGPQGMQRIDPRAPVAPCSWAAPPCSTWGPREAARGCPPCNPAPLTAARPQGAAPAWYGPPPVSAPYDLGPHRPSARLSGRARGWSPTNSEGEEEENGAAAWGAGTSTMSAIVQQSFPLNSARRSAASTLSAHQRSLYGYSRVHSSANAAAARALERQLAQRQREGGRPEEPCTAAGRWYPQHADARSGGTGSARRVWAGGPASGTPRAPRAAGDGDSAVDPVDDPEDCCIAAVLHNGAREVGVALVHFPGLSISLTQFGDSSTYAKLLALLYARNPVEVLLAATTTEDPLTKALIELFRDSITFTSVPRSYFATEKGVVRLNQLKSTLETTLSIEDTDRYLCLAAANALIRYVEGVSDMQFIPASVRVRTITPAHYADLSRSAARALHIICPSSGYAGCLRPIAQSLAVMRAAANGGDGVDDAGGRTRRRRARTIVYSSKPASYSSAATDIFSASARLETVPLVDALPPPRTPMGRRLLRSSLLQPLRDRQGIECRMDAVAWLLADPVGRMGALQRQLCALSDGIDLEKMSSMLSCSAGFQRSPREPLRVPAGQQQAMAAASVEHNKHVVACLMSYWDAVEALMGLERQLRLLLASDAAHCWGEPDACASGPDKQSVPCRPAEPVDSDDDEDAVRRAEGPTGMNDGSDRTQGVDADGSSTAADASTSTAERPFLFLRLLQTLRACRLESLFDVLGESLDASVREVRSVAAGLVPRGVRGSAGGAGSQRSRARRPNRSGAADQHSRLVRLAFAVKTHPGSALDVARSRFSERIRCITEYYATLCSSYQLFTLLLEPDAAGLFCLSYAAAEEAKTLGGPFTRKFAGGTHFALYSRALLGRRQAAAAAAAASPQHRRRDWASTSCRVSSLGADSPHTDPPAGTPSDGADDDDSACTSSEADDCTEHAPTNAESAGLLPPYLDPLPDLRACDRRAGAGPYRSARPQQGQPSGATDDDLQRRRRRHTRVRCTTEQLTLLCEEATEYLQDIFTEQVAHADALLAELRERIGCLQAMTEAVALLDMLLSFSMYSLMHACVRPRWLAGEEEEQQQQQEEVVTAADEEQRRAAVADDADSDAGGKAAHDSSRSEDSWCCSMGRSPTSEAGGLGSPRAVSLPAQHCLRRPLSPPVHPPDAGGDGACSGRSRERSDCQRAPARAICIRGARHPSQAPHQLTQWRGAASALAARATANTVTWEAPVRVLLLTGPNAAGKSTLLRIIGQIFTLAQCGCFVPCESAGLFIADRILAHMLCDELPLSQHSSRKRELMELAELSHAATAQSLVLVDELGRSMLSREGFSLAWAAVRWLRTVRCRSVFVTHFGDLSALSHVFPDVANFCFALTVSTTLPANATESPDAGESPPGKRSRAVPAAARTSFVAAHKLLPGVCTEVAYGLQAADRLGFYRPVLEAAWTLFRLRDDHHQQQQQQQQQQHSRSPTDAAVSGRPTVHIEEPASSL